MDGSKLLRILIDLQSDDATLGVIIVLNEIRTKITQATTQPQSFQNAEEQIKLLISNIQNTSIVYTFSTSEALILKKLNGDQYFGKGLISRMSEISNSRTYQMLAKIDDLANARNAFLQRSANLGGTLEAMGITPYRPDTFEVGLILPDDQNDYDIVLERLKYFDMLLSAFAEVFGAEYEKVKITRLSNGTLEFFSLQPAEVAEHLTTLLLNIAQI